MNYPTYKENTAIVDTEQDNRIHRDIGSMLRECLEYGTPDLFCHNPKKWSANVDLNTNSSIEGKVRSGFNHESPEDALEALLAKLRTLK